jgi:hypothetical protein
MASNLTKLLLFAMLFLALAGRVHATTDTIGGMTSCNYHAGGGSEAGRVVASASGTLQTLGINIQTVGSTPLMDEAIYRVSDGALLGNTLVVNANIGWNDVAVQQAVSIDLGTQYYLEVRFFAPTCLYRDGSIPSYEDGTFPGNPFASTYGGSYSTTDGWNQRMTYSTSTPYYALDSASVPSSIGYETQNQVFEYSLTFNSITVANAIVYLTQNNAAVASTKISTITGSSQTVSLGYRTSLLPTNDVVFTFNGYAVIGLISGATINTGAFNTFKQNEYWDYIPSTIAQKNAIIVRGNDNIFMNITQPVSLSLAIVNASSSQVGTSTTAYSTLYPYKYYRQLNSFLPTAYGYSNPTTSIPTNIVANSILQLYYNGVNVWRNTTASPAFGVYHASLVTCSPTFPTEVYHFTFWNASTGLQYTANVQLNGNFRLNNGNVIPGNTAGLFLTTNGFEYWTCEQPTGAAFIVNATLNYSTNKAMTLNPNTINSTVANYYFVNLPTSDVLQEIPLYLTYINNPSTYNIKVQNLSTGSFIPAIVEVMRYNINNGNSLVVNEVKTPSGGGKIVNLQTNAQYQFFVYSLTGEFLTNTTVETAYCTAGTVCDYVIPFGGGIIPSLQSFTSTLSYNCTTINLGGNSERVQCTLSTVGGPDIIGELQVLKVGSILNNVVCTDSGTSLTLTLTCIVPNTNTTSYHYILSAAFSVYGFQQITQGDFGYSSTQFGATGWLLLLMLVTVSSLGFIAIPALGMVGALLAILVAAFLGGITLAFGTIGALVLFFGLSIWILGRGGNQL